MNLGRRATPSAHVVWLKQTRAWQQVRLLFPEVQLPSLETKHTQCLARQCKSQQARGEQRAPQRPRRPGRWRRCAGSAPPAGRRGGPGAACAPRARPRRARRTAAWPPAPPPACPTLTLAYLRRKTDQAWRRPCYWRGCSCKIQACSASAGHAAHATLRAFPACSQERKRLAWPSCRDDMVMQQCVQATESSNLPS